MNSQENFTFYGNFSYGNAVYELKLAANDANKSYKIQVCKDDANCEESIAIANSYNQDIFFSALTAVMNKPKLVTTPAFDNNTNDIKTQWKAIYDKLMKELNKKEVLTELYDDQEVEYSGKIKLNKAITLAMAEKDNDCDCVANSQEQLTNEIVFIPKNASIRFFNNRLNSIAVHGTINNKEYTLLNNRFSVPFRFINQNGSKLEVCYNKKKYLLDYNDLLDYNPEGSECSYTVKNKSYEIKKGQEIKVESRNLFDYFTGIIFTDFLGLNNSTNSLLLAEGRVVIPMAYRNRRIWNAPQYFEAYLNTSVYNGQEEGQGFVEWSNPILTGNTPTKISMFEFFKKRNIETGLNFGLGSLEWKNIASIITLDYGINFYRSRLKYIKDTLNTSETYQVYALGHGPKLKIEIRPQVNFGADINLGVMGYNFNGINKSIGYDNFKTDVIEQKNTLYNMAFLTTNFYTKLNNKETNSGLYFRLAGFYDLKTSEVSPQIMVGYATNLTSFINKFKKKDEAITSTKIE